MAEKRIEIHSRTPARIVAGVNKYRADHLIDDYNTANNMVLLYALKTLGYLPETEDQPEQELQR